ncbi:D-xylose-proton symporter-like 1 [Galdieria sulphuraria]|nr:D-xylose-proton symporter-like 1 [Galdieria sulphuraria]
MELPFNKKPLGTVSEDTEEEHRGLQTSGGSETYARDIFRSKWFPPWFPSFFFPAIGCLLFGYDVGCTSSVLRVLGNIQASQSSSFGELSSLTLGFIAAASLFGALGSSLLAFRFGDSIGRKKELLLSAILYSIGTLMEALSPNLPLLFLARLIFGAGIGFSMHAAPIYIAECVPSDKRGLLISLKEAFIVTGMVFGYLVGALWEPSVSHLDYWLSWRFMFGSGIIFCLPFLLGVFFIPESPRWLLLKSSQASEEVSESFLSRSYMERARSSLIRLARNDKQAAEQQLILLSQAIREGSYSSEFHGVFSYSELLTPQSRKPLFVALSLVTFQQITGQPSVLYFANRLFEDTGLGFVAAVGLGIWKLIMTIVSSILVDKVGRRPLLLIGSTGITVTLFVLAWLFSGNGSYQIGFGPITWLVLSEIFPLRVRSASLAIGTLINFGMNLMVTSTFEWERECRRNKSLDKLVVQKWKQKRPVFIL